METFLPNDKVYKLLLSQIGHDSPVRGLPENAATADDPLALQDLTTTFITTMYYSALANLYLQGLLPKDIADIDEQMPRFKIVFSRTYADFTSAAEWLAKNGGEYIEASSAKQYYDEVRGMGETAVMDITTAYAQLK